ncbi:hypothetical protein DFH28DRAFT_836456, partial [Melampsora americana]
KLPPIHKQLILLCKTMKQLDLSPKKFVQHFFTNNDAAMEHHQGKWVAEEGGSAKKVVLS